MVVFSIYSSAVDIYLMVKGIGWKIGCTQSLITIILLRFGMKGIVGLI